MSPPLPDIDSLASVGGSLQDYSAVKDPTVERPASGANTAYYDAVAATNTVPRAWARITLNGSATPILVAHAATWGNALAVAPTPARSTNGLYTVTWPATVNDEIPPTSPGGGSNPHTVNLRWGNANVRGATIFQSQVDITSANVATLRISPATSGTLTDPGSATDVDVVVY